MHPTTRKGSITALACLVLLPVIARAQLPNPTYGWNLGSTVNIAPAAVTNTSNGNSWQTLDVVFTSPVTLNMGATYYINVTSATAGNKPYFVDVSAANTYSSGTYTGSGGGSRDMWFQVWGQ